MQDDDYGRPLTLDGIDSFTSDGARGHSALAEWTDRAGTPVGDEPQVSRVPEWPGAIAPSPVALRASYEAALDEVYAARNDTRPEGEYADAMREAGFRASYNAVFDSCAGQRPRPSRIDR